MKPDVYKRHIKNFSNHWWFQARKKIIESIISKNFKRKLQRDGFFKVVKLKSVYEKPSEKKKRILQENIKRVKKLNKLKNRI